MRNRRQKADYPLALTVFALVLFGLIMISSASVVLSFEAFGTNNYFLIRQLIFAGIGMALLVIASSVDYHFWRKLAPFLFVTTLVLLTAVFLPGIGTSLKGASRWIIIGPLNFQPTEVVKLIFILFLAAWLENKGEKIKDLKYGFLPFVAMVGMITGLIVLQPDLGTSVIIGATAMVMLYVSGASNAHVAGGAIGGIAIVYFFIISSAYRLSRFKVFLDPASDVQGEGYHINQALIALGSGGLFGLGFGNSRQKYNYLPEAAGDSIFAIIGEELGFIGAVIVIGLFAFFAYRGYRIIRRAPDAFGRLVATGIVFWIVFQAFVNIGAMVSLLPLTGVTLPFISYGGSSVIMSLVGIGILLNISKQSSQEESYAHPSVWRRDRRSRVSNTRNIRRIRKVR